MNRIASRAWVTWFLIAVLLGGTGLFVYEYLIHGENWVLSPGSPHIYDDHGKVTGTIVDRNGVLLLDQRDGGTYAQQEQLRKAILHWVGDRKGNIQAGAMSHYSKLLSGYDPINGVYVYGGVGGTASLTISAQLQMAALEAMGADSSALLQPNDILAVEYCKAIIAQGSAMQPFPPPQDTPCR